MYDSMAPPVVELEDRPGLDGLTDRRCDAAHHDVEQALRAAALLEQRLRHHQRVVRGAAVEPLHQRVDHGRRLLRALAGLDLHDQLDAVVVAPAPGVGSAGGEGQLFRDVEADLG
jgi:hypothetical protein